MRRGYGRISWRSKSWIAHRLAWVLVKGDIPEGMVICHACDNPPCVNPTHLFLGTVEDNIADRQRKGRGAHQVNPNHKPAAKLSEVDVKKIRALEGSGLSQAAIAEKFGISRAQVQRIHAGVNWS